MSRHLARRVVAATAATLALAACSTEPAADDGAGGATDGGDDQPIAVEHAFGTTEVPAAATDVVTLGWGSTEAALALGVVPVGIEGQTYAADENGLLPWVDEALAEVEAEPTILPANVEEPAYEDIAAVEPDVILAPYSGITQEQYDLLSEIAPTVVYPEEPWTTPWRDVVTIVGTSLGLDAEADQLVGDLDATLEEAADAHPELEGVTVAAIWDTGTSFYVYKPADSRVDFLLDLGLESAPSVEALATGDESFFYTLSYEQTDQLAADLVVNYASAQQDVDTFLTQPYARAIPAVADGAVANIVGDQLVSAMSPPTALSLEWGLTEYVETISAAVAEIG